MNYRISKLREYLFDIIDTLTKNNKYQINADMLGDIGDYSLNKMPTDTEVESWIIGVVKRKDIFSFRSRRAYSQDELNNLTNNEIYPNQELIIIENEEPIINDEYDIYEVVKGDSLWTIANRYNIRVNDLIDLNNLTDLTISIGQKLLVPKKDIDENIYIVEKGDTLWSVSRKNNITVQELKELNNLTNNTISIGQVLKIK